MSLHKQQQYCKCQMTDRVRGCRAVTRLAEALPPDPLAGLTFVDLTVLSAPSPRKLHAHGDFALSTLVHSASSKSEMLVPVSLKAHAGD